MTTGNVELAQGPSTLAEYFKAYVVRLRSGELGALPIIIGIVLMGLVFGTQSDVFLTPRNITNLIVQASGLTAIAIGVVFVLLIAEIDLSVAWVGGVGAAMLAVLLRSTGLPWPLVVVAALTAVSLIGIVQGAIVAKLGVPSFVVSLAGLLAWNGVVLLIVGRGGTIVIQDKVIIGIANTFLSPSAGWLVATVVVGIFAASQFTQRIAKGRRGLPTKPLVVAVAQVAGAAALVAGLMVMFNRDRGLPLVTVIILVLLVGFGWLASRTKFGRHVYAVGGNPEAARRAGINVARIKIIVFMISSLMAGVGAIILASRLRSVDNAVGGGNLLLNAIAAAVIGGTSLFGGRGRVVNALLGALVIQSVENGLGLLGRGSGEKFIISGLVLLAAVIVDSVGRRNGQSGSK
jgi:D-xylose transport system permease protein